MQLVNFQSQVFVLPYTFQTRRQTAVVTTRTLSAFPDDRLFSVLLNSPAKIFRLSLGCHPLYGVARGAP